MLGGHPGLNSTHVRPYSLNLEGAVAALSYVPIISPFSLRLVRLPYSNTKQCFLIASKPDCQIHNGCLFLTTSKFGRKRISFYQNDALL
jgi:hypothetical protein